MYYQDSGSLHRRKLRSNYGSETKFIIMLDLQRTKASTRRVAREACTIQFVTPDITLKTDMRQGRHVTTIGMQLTEHG